MSRSVALQKAVFAALSADSGVDALVDGRIYEVRPADAALPCITFGPSDFTIEDDAQACVYSEVEALQIDTWSQDGGQLSGAKALNSAVVAALHKAQLDVSPYRLLSLDVTLARAFLDADDITAHGVVTIEADIE